MLWALFYAEKMFLNCTNEEGWMLTSAKTVIFLGITVNSFPHTCLIETYSREKQQQQVKNSI